MSQAKALVLETLARKRFNYMYTTCHHVRDGQIYHSFCRKTIAPISKVKKNNRGIKFHRKFMEFALASKKVLLCPWRNIRFFLVFLAYYIWGFEIHLDTAATTHETVGTSPLWRTIKDRLYFLQDIWFKVLLCYESFAIGFIVRPYTCMIVMSTFCSLEQFCCKKQQKKVYGKKMV